MSVADEIRSKGKRMTVQRRLVLDALQRSRHPQIDPSTVYRNLEALEGLGYVTHTHLDDRVTRWHRADVERHGHLVCRRCGSEQEIPLRTLEPLGRRLRAEQGFRADLAHSAIVGICRECAP